MVTIYDIQNKFVGRFKSNLHFTAVVYGFSSIHTKKTRSLNSSVDILQQTCYQQPISGYVHMACDSLLATSSLLRRGFNDFLVSSYTNAPDDKAFL